MRNRTVTSKNFGMARELPIVKCWRNVFQIKLDLSKQIEREMANEESKKYSDIIFMKLLMPGTSKLDFP